ncbi:MAG TPA: dicarboxylate/amino acid:cation symporter, partial [Sphingobacteriaceae bacterium]|nr:dicarboxylate/amino acid:cation symporter [Sphingobacteriaceae bacterium]
MKFKYIGSLVLIFISLAAVLAFLSYYNILPVDSVVLQASRWLVLLSLFIYGFKKQSLTTWILISMFVGAEIGHDYPAVGVNLQVLSKVFLKMIKTIVAPLLFGTLVYGIAGHSDLKQVGRMGWKSILYFEVVTTLALFIGLLAINISQAGAGITLPPGHHEELQQIPPQTASDIILHIFPENIAKSIAEGQILQIVIFSIIFGIALAMVREDKRAPML